MTNNNNHQQQHVTLTLLLPFNQTKSPKPNTNMAHLSPPLTKPNHPNPKPTSHKPDVVVDLTNLLHCYQQDPSPPVAPFPHLNVEITRKEKEKKNQEIDLWIRKEKDKNELLVLILFCRHSFRLIAGIRRKKSRNHYRSTRSRPSLSGGVWTHTPLIVVTRGYTRHHYSSTSQSLPTLFPWLQ